MATVPPIQAANIGFVDSIILMVMALVVFGPRRLPQIGRQVGRLMYELRKASNDFKFQMEEELRLSEEADRRKRDEERLAQAASTTAAPAETAPAEAAKEPIPSPYPGESFYPAEYPRESAPAAAEPEATHPTASEPVESKTPQPTEAAHG